MSDRESDNEEPEVVEDLTDNKVVTKYNAAAKIANDALAHVIKLCTADAKVVDICVAGDEFINAATGKIYNKPKLDKGVAFPTCVSINNIVGHFSPLSSDETKLANGDLVKIDLGCQIDGFIAVVAHTLKVFAQDTPKADRIVTGRQADVLMAAHTAAECALRLMKPGNTNTRVSEIIGKVAAEFKCNPVQGVISHQMLRNVIDGKRVILNKPDIENKVDEIEFEPAEVFAVDIVMSTGEGKAKESQERTTIFKRSMESSYSLRMKASRQVFSQIKERFTTFPFTLRSLDEKKARFGIVELQNHNLVDAYPVLYETEGEYIAHIKFTCMQLPNGPTRATGAGYSVDHVRSEHKVTDEDVLAVLATSVKKKKKRKKKKKKAKSN